MEDHRDSQFVDELLDAGLAQYRGVEPRPGLENRILAQLHAEQKASPWLAWAWRMGAGLLAAGIILALVLQARRQRPHVPVSVTESSRPAPAVASEHGRDARATARQSSGPRHNTGSADLALGSADLAHPLVGPNGPPGRAGRASFETASGRRAARPYRGPRRDVFPSPAPLSEEEKLLLSYVRQLPEGALAAFPEDDQPLASLTVPDLKMPPLETKGTFSNTTDEMR